MKIHAVLLAAGRSTRLGSPKQLVVLGAPPETLLARAARILSTPVITSLRVVLGEAHAAIDEEAARTGARIVRSIQHMEGSAASIRAAVADLQATESAPYGILFAVVDQPAVTPAHMTTLVNAFTEARGARPVASRYAGARGVPAIFPSTYESDLLSLRGDSGAKGILRADPTVIEVDLPFGEHDIDVPTDLEGLSS